MISSCRPHGRLRRTGALVVVLSLVLGGVAGAQIETATTEAVEEGHRELELLSLTGAPLEDLALRQGRPAPFEVRVTDTGADPQRGFKVQVTMTNLYRSTDQGYVHAQQIPLRARRGPGGVRD